MTIDNLANDLGITGFGVKDKSEKIKNFALSRLNEIYQANDVVNVDSLLEFCCCDYNLKFEVFTSQEELEAIIKKYIEVGEIVFASFSYIFDDNTFATLVQLKSDAFVAVIDSTGEKAYRENFTKWHEVAHLITANGKIEGTFHRSTKHDPLESLMDDIAAEAAFFHVFFDNKCLKHLSSRKLDFNTIQFIRDNYFPKASFMSTLYKCLKSTPYPTLFLECDLAYNKKEKDELNNCFLDDSFKPQPKLRAINVQSSQNARKSKLRIYKNMRVPECSIISILFKNKDIQQSNNAYENLSSWTDSKGNKLEDLDVRVDTKVYRSRIIALISES